MERVRGYLVGQAALTTACPTEKQRLDMIDPFSEETAEYMNLSRDEDELWVWDSAGIKISDISVFNDYAPGIVRVESQSGLGLSLRGSVKELLELI